MRNGEIVEQGRVADVFKSPQHSYTKALLDNFQRLRQPGFLNLTELGDLSNLLVINNLKTEFSTKKDFFGKPVQTVKAIDEISLEIRKGETLGLVGESGSGKTTLGRSLLKLVEPGGGAVHYKGADLLQLPDSQWKPLRKELQIIFQDPYSSLHPKMTIGEAIMEPMRVHGLHRNEKGRRDKAIELLETVGLDATHFHRLPKAFSGGQRQRICIARALSLDPVFMVCDECVSALDVTTQIQVLDLLRVLQQKRGLTYLFISHDLSVVQKISHRIAVMKNGKIVEMGTTESVLRHPFSVYTRQLVESIPKGIG
jgi:peptide/nickel transport system ATP-binding protein